MGGGGRRSLHVVTAQPCLAGKRGDLPARQAFRDRQRHFLAEAGLHQGRQRSAIAHVALEGVDPGAVLAGVAVERSAQAKEEARGDNAIARQQRGDLAAIGPLRDAHGDGAGTSSVKRLVERDNEPSGEDENTEHDKRDQPADQDARRRCRGVRGVRGRRRRSLQRIIESTTLPRWTGSSSSVRGSVQSMSCAQSPPAAGCAGPGGGAPERPRRLRKSGLTARLRRSTPPHPGGSGRARGLGAVAGDGVCRRNHAANLALAAPESSLKPALEQVRRSARVFARVPRWIARCEASRQALVVELDRHIREARAQALSEGASLGGLRCLAPGKREWEANHDPLDTTLAH